MTRRLITALPLLLALTTPAMARADGLPVIGYEVSNNAITSANGAYKYVTHAGRRDTRLQRISRDGVIKAVRIPGRLVVPVVAYDGSSAGLSYDQGTLVLIRSRVSFPQKETRLAIVDPKTLTIRREIALRGDFSFDAISPNGRWLYLIQYTARFDPTQYRVRSLDTATGLLLPGSIVDRSDRGEAMHGNPLTRVTSANGRFAYTLYDGNGRPFVHALDTSMRTARCIDVAPFPPTADPFTLRLVLVSGQHRLAVTGRGRTLDTIDTAAFKVVKPTATSRRVASSDATAPIAATLLVAAAAIGLLAAGYGARRSISQRPPAARA